MAKQMTHAEIREKLGHNGAECRVKITKDGRVLRHGSPVETDRSKDYWQDMGRVEDYERDTYRIEVREDGRWIPAPGEATGWTLEEAKRAASGQMYGLDGTPIPSDQVRIVCEQTGEAVDAA